jgi:glyoxylase-like metal-dependent hydrolase (beta-lactamase superfamily II)
MLARRRRAPGRSRRARRGARVLVAALLAWAAGAFGAPFPEPVSLGHGVYAFLGTREEPSRANRGHVANQGFIAAAEGVIVIDSGSNAAFAEHMLQAIRARTSKPLAIVILTQPVDAAIFGATVLQRHGGPVLAHEAAAKLMAERCETCLKNLTSALGEGVMGGTRLPRPDRVFKGSQRLAVAGRSLELLDYSGAAVPGSIAVWDRESGILFAGGLASFERIPETRDGALDDWIKALRELASGPARAIVPAHGPIGNRASLESLAAYLSALDRRTAQAYAGGRSLVDAPRAVAVPEYQGWALYESVHPRNVHHAYLARERRELAKP